MKTKLLKKLRIIFNAMKELYLDKEKILLYQKNRPPYLMIDIADKVIPGILANGYKLLSNQDWFFDCHFPGDPNMPGLLQTEALVQMAALTVLTMPGNKGKIIYLYNVEKITFKQKVLIGDKFNIETKLLSWKRGIGKCYGIAKVNNKKVCESIFNIVLPSELEKFKVKAKT